MYLRISIFDLHQMTKNDYSKGVVYINGNFFLKHEAQISVFDQGFIFGDAIFDTLTVSNGYIFKINEHLDRLYKSAKAVDIHIPCDRKKLINIMIETVKKTQLKDAYLKCIVTRGVNEKPVMGKGDVSNSTIVVFAVPPVSIIDSKKINMGVNLISTSIKRAPFETLDPRIKSTNYLPNMLMRRQAIASGADEALSYDQNGYITEAGAANIFLVHYSTSPPKNIVIYTPDQGILEGITRNTVFDIVEKKNLGECLKKNLTRYDVFTSDEIFLTSTAGGIFPVIAVDNIGIGDGKPGKITKIIIDNYYEMLKTGTHGIQVYN